METTEYNDKFGIASYYKEKWEVEERDKKIMFGGMHRVWVLFEDSKYNYCTSVSPQSTEESAKEYFVNAFEAKESVVHVVERGLDFPR